MRVFLAYLYNDLRLSARSWYKVLSVYVLLPLVLVAIMSFAMNSVFEAETFELDLEIQIDNQDSGIYGQAFIDSLKQEPLSDYFSINKDANIQVKIPMDFSQATEKSQIEITTTGKYSIYNLEMVKQVVEAWQAGLIEQEILSQQIASLDSNQAASFQQDMQVLAQTAGQSYLIKEKTKSEDSLNAVEYYLIVAIIYVFVMGMSSQTGFIIQEEFKGLGKRLGIVPLSHLKRVIFSWLSNLIQMFIYACLVLLLVSFYPKFNASHALNLLPWMLLYAAIFIALGQVLAEVGSKVLAMTLIQIVSIGFVITSMIPLGEMVGGQMGEILNQNWGKKFLIDPMQSTLLGQVHGQHLPVIWLGLTMIVVFLGITFLIAKRKGAH